MSPELKMEELPEDVREELLDPEYSHLQHYSRSTYRDGCRGPLCRLREAHRGRRRTLARAQDEKREYQPGVRTTEREEDLVLIARWHISERAKDLFSSVNI